MYVNLKNNENSFFNCLFIIISQWPLIDISYEGSVIASAYEPSLFGI